MDDYLSLVVHKQPCSGRQREGGPLLHDYRVADQVGFAGRQGGVGGETGVAAQAGDILAAGFHGHGGCDPVDAEIDMGQHVDREVLAVLGQGGLHEYENRVVGAYLDIAETATAHAVDVDAELAGFVVAESDVADVHYLVVTVVDDETACRRRAEGQQRTHPDCVGRECRLVGG